MNPQMLQQLLGGQGSPSSPATSGPQASQGGQQGPGAGPSGPPWIPLLDQALSKLANMGVPFASDISNLIMSGGGNPQSWGTLLKAIDAYGKHKQSVQAGNVPQPGQTPQPGPQSPPSQAPQPQGPMAPGMSQ